MAVLAPPMHLKYHRMHDLYLLLAAGARYVCVVEQVVRLPPQREYRR